MSELYWITRLDAIHGLGIALLVTSILALVALSLTCLIEAYSFEEYLDRLKNNFIKKIHICLLCTLTLGTLIVVFCPTKQDLYLIYGLGGTIDYIESNPEAQKIPDKCVNALNRWIDSLNEEK